MRNGRQVSSKSAVLPVPQLMQHLRATLVRRGCQTKLYKQRRLLTSAFRPSAVDTKGQTTTHLCVQSTNKVGVSAAECVVIQTTGDLLLRDQRGPQSTKVGQIESKAAS